MSDVLLRGGLPWGLGSPADLLVRDGLIHEVGPGLDAPGARVIDITGQLVLPGLVEAHCHLDKTLYGGPWVPHSADDTLAGRIGNDLGRRAELGVPDTGRITALLERMSAAGTTHVRTHTDIDPQVGLRGVEAVGGLDPAGIDRDPVRHLDVIFGLAERYGAHVDIHLHDGGTLGGWELELIIERTRTLGLGGRVAVSHAYALGQLDEAAQDRLAQGLAEAGVALVTAAVYNFPVPPVKKLRAAPACSGCGATGWRRATGPTSSCCRAAARRRPWSFTLRALWS